MGQLIQGGTAGCRLSRGVDRQHRRAGACLCSGRKKSRGETEALGRSVGGFSCKIHVLTDALGYPLRLRLTPGQTADVTQAKAIVTGVPIKVLLADKGYDSQDFVDYLHQQGIEALIPSRSHAKQPRPYDRVVYKERHLIECFFSKIKQYRRVFTRFDKKAQNFLSFLYFVSVLIWTR